MGKLISRDDDYGPTVGLNPVQDWSLYLGLFSPDAFSFSQNRVKACVCQLCDGTGVTEHPGVWVGTGERRLGGQLEETLSSTWDLSVKVQQG